MKRVLKYLGVVFVFMLAAYFALYWLSLKTLTVNFSGVSSVEIYSASSLESGKPASPIAKIDSSGQSKKLRPGEYKISYAGNKDYQSGFMPVVVDQNKSITISPGFSDARLNKILAIERPAIIQAIKADHPEVSNLYEIQPGKLYENGEWYGTVLVYRGNDQFNSDSLRAVLKKESGKWVVKSEPFYIYLSRYSYPDIPLEILKSVNAMPGGVTGDYRSNR